MENLILKGGWVMWPILVGSVVALALVLERSWYFWSIRLDLANFSQKIFSLIERGDTQEAIRLCSQTEHPIGELYKTAIEHIEEEPSEIDRVMEREGNRQMGWVNKHLGFLLVIVGIEPLLGFLGTILGLIKAFMAWEQLGASVTVSALAAGIYQAMITTAAGLIVSIPYFVLYHIFMGRVNAVEQDLNHYGNSMISAIAKAKKFNRV